MLTPSPSLRPYPPVPLGVPDVATGAGLDVVNVEVVNDDMLHELDGEAGTVGDVNVRPPTVDGLVVVDHQLLLELDDHVTGEDDPEWPVAGHAVAEGAWPGVQEVVVRRICNHINRTTQAAFGVAAEALGALGQKLAVARPIAPAPPAPVDRVCGNAFSAFSFSMAKAPPGAVEDLEDVGGVEVVDDGFRFGNVGLHDIGECLGFPLHPVLIVVRDVGVGGGSRG